MQLGLCSVLHIHYAMCCVTSENSKLVSNMKFLHHLNQSLSEMLVVQGCICARHSGFCWFGTVCQQGNSKIPFIGIAAGVGKELFTHMQKSTPRIHKMCPIYSSSVVFVKSLILIFIEYFLLLSVSVFSLFATLA